MPGGRIRSGLAFSIGTRDGEEATEGDRCRERKDPMPAEPGGNKTRHTRADERGQYPSARKSAKDTRLKMIRVAHGNEAIDGHDDGSRPKALDHPGDQKDREVGGDNRQRQANGEDG